MAISQADLKTISTVFGKNIDEISGAISSGEEVSLGLRLEGKIYNDDQVKAFKESGVQQGKEIGVKDIARALEIELEAGEKDPVKVAEKLKNTISLHFEEKYKNPNPTAEQLALAKKADEWKGKYDTLFETYNTKEKEVVEWKEKYNQKEEMIKNETRNSIIRNALPKDILLSTEDALMIINGSFKYEQTEDGQTMISNGKTIYKTPVGEPDTLENAVKAFSEEKGWLKSNGGMGGKDEKRIPSLHKKGLSPTEALKYIKEKGLEPASQEGLTLYRELTSK